jgi:Protein of unknown function (DUF4058)
MKSPFPGMDPYIEACSLWGDFHLNLVAKIADQLAEVAPERYLIRSGERSYVVLVDPEEGKTGHPFVPDVSVATRAGRKPSARKAKASQGVALADPATEARPQSMTIRALIEEEYRETFVEIYEAEPEQRLVTSLEVLSPSNKRSNTPGWDLYLRKRQGLLRGKVNLVEIDLLRGGQRMPMRDAWPDSPYTLLVARPDKAHRCLVWPAHFQHPLTTISIPLVPPDPDIPLALQPMIDGIYQRFRYYRSIDYDRPLSPPLSPRETTWLKQQLRVRAATA